mmetsp:Transcript_38168/g.83823  ORF Transcript_38168/g.83823 Transcript_38168/m.83823 type:complete len:164 (-) Transcript_38168:975-1466(-)
MSFPHRYNLTSYVCHRAEGESSSAAFLLCEVKNSPSKAPDAMIAAQKIITPPKFSLGDISSPSNIQAKREAKIGSLERTMLDSAAESTACPRCCRTPASAPDPTAENTSSPHTLRSLHPGHIVCTPSQPAPSLLWRINAATRNHAIYMIARIPHVAAWSATLS